MKGKDQKKESKTWNVHRIFILRSKNYGNVFKPHHDRRKEVNAMGKISEALIPADFETSVKTLGIGGVFKFVLKAAWRYKRTVKYLVRNRGTKALRSFLFTKLFLPTGEGAGEGALPIVGPLIRRFPQLAPYPLNIEIEVTTRCNKRCILCEHTHWNEPSVDLSFKEFKKIIDQFPKLRWINLTGEGDAFLNKDYLKMIKYSKSKDVAVYLVDSFDLINKEIAEKLVQSGVDGIYISMDAATKETYEKIKVGCKFERTVENIKNLIKIKEEMKSPIPEICFRYIITTLNVHEMPKFVELVRSIGSWDSFGDGSKVHFIGLLTFKEIEQYYLPKLPEKIVGETIRKSKEDKNNLPVVFPHIEPEKFPSINRCLAWMEPYIMISGGEPGYVIPCCAVLMSNKREFLRKHSFGNILEEPFKKIWNSERYRRFRQTVNRPNAEVPLLCRGCRSYDTRKREEKYGIDPGL